MGFKKTGSSSDHHHRRRRSSKKNPKTRRKEKSKRDRKPTAHEALCRATDDILRKIILSDEHLSNLPSDCTLEELQGEIAIARGLATTIYVKRDGLSTLKVVLSQQSPTIANLKRAIERTANLAQQRERSPPPPAGEQHKSKSSDRRGKETVKKSSSDTPPRRSGELVAAASTRAERPHRCNPSWRFLWRAYALTKAQDTHQTGEQPATNPLPDANGRQLLSDFGIGHKSVLRFVKRENYFGRRRQRS